MQTVYDDFKESLRGIRLLNTKEIYFIRLVLHGYKTYDIVKYLEIEIEQYYKIINSIKLKLNCTSWYKVVIKSFELEIIKLEDFLDNLVKEEALLFEEEIMSKLIKEKVSNKEIRYLVSDFYNSCTSKLENLCTDVFSEEEKFFLRLKFEGNNDESIERKLKLEPEEVNTYQEKLFIKLQVNDWFNALKKAIQFGVLKIKDELHVDFEIHVYEVSVNMISINSFKNYSYKEKKLSIYLQLLRFYSKLELDYLSKASM
ncbi:hypothetical protein FHS04_000863 [Mesoflavibacter sabulilitoris]|uniref:Uncharacterized protein n=1 Tax=Mesoflavibacter zeaxanthinifaciens subsp. sabulilitoris TaxID=1520893 RepID=A0A2T1N5W8_9FLAO|nr:hypothetical protein [Mesoflavibacter zeaxanthinifaciens]MBB3123366.1 hypothetical protein [Mesoflavibacter zeaxanthinifaciens subsp. sabulilitoris]PSG87002.1 hypothetical protein C7H61_12895 [Mesoflavibacter zeaxanthinifaciens subsp. sabulilitoris]